MLYLLNSEMHCDTLRHFSLSHSTIKNVQNLASPNRHRRTVTEHKNKACDVTVWTWTIKLYLQIECQLGFLMMLI